MTQREWLAVGIKFLGIYFAVLGVTGLIIVGTHLVVDEVMASSSDRTLRVGGIALVNVLQPLAYLLCAFILTKRTEWCVRMAGLSQEDGPANRMP
jgi:hypothetical protein